MRRLARALAACVALASWPAWGAQLPPGVPVSGPVDTNTVTPQGASQSTSLAAVLSGTRFPVRRGHIRAWKPYAGGPAYDTGGTYWTGTQSKEGVETIEVPSDVTDIQVVFAAGPGGSVTVANAAVAGSSQLAPSGYTGATPGITPYDASGSALSTMTTLSFGNAGADSDPPLGNPTSVPAAGSSLSTNASTAAGNVTLTFAAGFACPALGATVETINTGTATNGPFFYPNTTVQACSSSGGTITMSLGARAAVPNGQTVYFLLPGITIPASVNGPLPSLVFSDWAPITTPPRIDGLVAAGMSLLKADGTLLGTVSSTAATSATLGTTLAADLPSGTNLLACQAGTLSADLVPNASFQFASNANIVPGLIVWPSPTFGPRQSQWPQNTVASVSTAGGNTTVVLTTPPPGNLGSNSSNWGSGINFAFGKQVTVTGVNGNQVTVDDASLLSLGMAVWQGTGGLNAGAFYGGTITGISGNVLTMSAAPPANVVTGMPLVLYFTASTNSPQTVPNPSWSTTPPNVVPGMKVVSGYAGASYPSDALAFYAGSLLTTRQPSATIPASNKIYYCNPVTTSAKASVGQNTVPFGATSYPNRLVTVRVNYGSLNAGFWGAGLNAASAIIRADPGNGLLSLGYNCAAGSDGVLGGVSSVSNGGGGCGVSFAPIYAIKMYSPQRGITLATVADSHFGDTTGAGGGSNGFVARLAALMNKPNTSPVTYLNTSWGGQPSTVFGPNAMAIIRSFKPEVVMIQYTTPNDSSSSQAIANMSATANAIARYVESYGGTPILLPDYQRQRYGATADFATNTAFRLAGEAALNTAAQTGTPTVDLPILLGDPVNGVLFFASSMSDDAIHGNDAAHIAMAAALASRIQINAGN